MVAAGRALALAAVLILISDPVWCADGCTTEPLAAHQTEVSSCAACNRSVAPETAELAPLKPTVVVFSTVSAPCWLPIGWRSPIEHPPRII